MASSVGKRPRLDVQGFIDKANAEYESVHKAFEDQFWGTKMDLEGTFNTELLTSTKNDMEAWLRSRERLDETRSFLKEADISAEQRKVLTCFERTFSTYLLDSAEATATREAVMADESALEEARGKMELGFTHNGTFTEASSVGLRTRMRTNGDESLRKACFEGLESIGSFVVENGFAEIIKQRNRLARMCGFVDFYDMKVTQAEGFGKETLFGMLDELEVRTRDLNLQARERLAKEKGPGALEPWNMNYLMSGSTEEKLDPYFPFEKALESWGRSYAALGISYRGATMNLDLLDRKGKYSNGFCHWPQPAWVKPNGEFQPSQANFTSLADPNAIGSGKTALTTLMHEAGHAAHFANIVQPSPLFSQERAPTSVAYAENQSMFLDSLVSDAAWRGRYALDRAGSPLPWALHEEELRATHPFAVFQVRGMLAVPYFEKALYELEDDAVVPAKILELAAEIEEKIQGGPAARPLLSVPHILSDEASCYYHGYVLAEMSVWHTRAHFLQDGKRIVDNPEVGKALTEAYWEAGNSEMFLDLVQALTTKPLSCDAWVADLEQDLEDKIVAEKADYEWAIAPRQELKSVDLDMRMRVLDGDEILADSERDGGFLAACSAFEEKVKARKAAAKL